MVDTVCQRIIKDRGDMAIVEDCILRQLGGEHHRCAFFRSVAYIRLRIAALYLSKNPRSSHVAYCGDLSVSLIPTAEGPLVSVHCSYEPVYPDDFEPFTGKCAEDAAESFESIDALDLQQRKRMRS